MKTISQKWIWCMVIGGTSVVIAMIVPLTSPVALTCIVIAIICSVIALANRLL